jgi:O-antigen/teichoic acid export membrane protein
MLHTARIRFWIEAVLAVLTAALFVLTLFSREWIELVFGVDPDRGSGALEWAIVATLLLATVTLTVAARVEWRRRASAAA